MLFGLSASVLVLMVAVSMCAFFVSMSMDGIIGDRGFGVIGNMVILSVGFYLGHQAATSLGLPHADIILTTLAGMTGSFLALSVLSVVKSRL